MICHSIAWRNGMERREAASEGREPDLKPLPDLLVPLVLLVDSPPDATEDDLRKLEASLLDRLDLRVEFRAQGIK